MQNKTKTPAEGLPWRTETVVNFAAVGKNHKQIKKRRGPRPATSLSRMSLEFQETERWRTVRKATIFYACMSQWSGVMLYFLWNHLHPCLVNPPAMHLVPRRDVSKSMATMEVILFAFVTGYSLNGYTDITPIILQPWRTSLPEKTAPVDSDVVPHIPRINSTKKASGTLMQCGFGMSIGRRRATSNI